MQVYLTRQWSDTSYIIFQLGCRQLSTSLDPSRLSGQDVTVILINFLQHIILVELASVVGRIQAYQLSTHLYKISSLFIYILSIL